MQEFLDNGENEIAGDGGLDRIKDFDKCRELGINNVLIDCDKNNIGSAKSIQNNGGILENEIYVGNELVQRYWISLKKRFVINPNDMEIIKKGNLKKY